MGVAAGRTELGPFYIIQFNASRRPGINGVACRHTCNKDDKKWRQTPIKSYRPEGWAPTG